MKPKSQKNPHTKNSGKKKGLSPFRRFTTVVSILVILGLTLVVYQKFGLGDAWVWVQDVLILILIMFLVFLAAVFVVWLLMLYRKHKGEL